MLGDPYSDPRAVFYHMLRPEFVLQYGKPLVSFVHMPLNLLLLRDGVANTLNNCSDAFSGWGKHDPDFQQQNAAVFEAKMHLFKSVIPKFARELEELDARIGPHVPLSAVARSIDLISILHRAGVNVRHLGRVRSLLESERMKQLLLTEMTCRIIKNSIRNDLRTLMEALKYLSSEQVKEVIVKHMNRAISDKEYLGDTFKQVLLVKFRSVVSYRSKLHNIDANLSLCVVF
jgi:hypothetical protein